MPTNNDRAPPPLRKLLDLDVKITNQTVQLVYKYFPQFYTQTWKSVFKVLEISCHGVPWIALTLIAIYMIKSYREVQINLMAALIYDIVLIALIKAVTRRSRPTTNIQDTRSSSSSSSSTTHGPMFFTHGPDKFSFPSGHASRSMLLLLLFNSVTDGCLLVNLVVGVWAAMICLSRVIMRRHHVLDVLCGVLFGVLEWGLVGMLWVGEERSRRIGAWIAGVEDEFDGS